MVNLSAEAKNPTKDLPQVILVATIAIAIFYALIAMVAGGVLPVSETANQPLDLVARAIMPTPVFLFFVIGGAVGPDYDSERHLRMDHQAHPTGLQRRLAAP